MQKGQWTFLTNHGRVFVYVAGHPRTTTRNIALEVGITERAIQNVIQDLEADGYIVRHREGRNNFYEIHPEMPMRHPMEGKHAVRSLLLALRCGFTEVTKADK